MTDDFFYFFDYLVSIPVFRWTLAGMIILWLCSAFFLLLLGDELTEDYPDYDDDVIDSK